MDSDSFVRLRDHGALTLQTEEFLTIALDKKARFAWFASPLTKAFDVARAEASKRSIPVTAFDITFSSYAPLFEGRPTGLFLDWALSHSIESIEANWLKAFTLLYPKNPRADFAVKICESIDFIVIFDSEGRLQSIIEPLVTRETLAYQIIFDAKRVLAPTQFIPSSQEKFDFPTRVFANRR